MLRVKVVSIKVSYRSIVLKHLIFTHIWCKEHKGGRERPIFFHPLQRIDTI